MKISKPIKRNSAKYLKKKLGLRFTPIAVVISAPDIPVRRAN